MRATEQIIGKQNLSEFLLRSQIDFKFFCEKILSGSPLFLNTHGGIHEYQLEWFQLVQNNSRVIIQAPAGFSKTTILAVAYPIWLAMNNRNKQILIISKSLPQSTRVLGIIRLAIEENELLKELKPKDASESWSKQEIRTTTKCRIYCRPYSINLKGERIDYMILDEAASYENTNIFFDYIIPRLNPKGKMVLISTPESPTDLLHTIRARTREYIFRTYPAIVNGSSIWPERFPLELLKKRKEEQGEEFFEKNYMCNPRAESEDSIFSKKAIIKCFDIERGFASDIEGRGFIGCDFAISKGPNADYDAYVVIDKTDNFFIIKKIEIYKGVLTPGKVRRIKQLNELYNPVKMRVDETNLGSTIVDELKAEALPVIPQDFHPQKRRKMLNALRNIIDSGKLVIPRSPDDTRAVKLTNELFDQLIGFKEVVNKLTGNKNFVSTSPHDDIVMALAMAVSEAIKQKSTSVFIASHA